MTIIVPDNPPISQTNPDRISMIKNTPTISHKFRNGIGFPLSKVVFLGLLHYTPDLTCCKVELHQHAISIKLEVDGGHDDVSIPIARFFLHIFDSHSVEGIFQNLQMAI